VNLNAHGIADSEKKNYKTKKQKTIQKTTENKKQKIIKIKTPGKQILNRRLRKNKITK
jgi:hypothetical protein